MTSLDSAYWSVIAQVVPVLALALVLEARGIARRWTKKADRPALKMRLLAAASLAALALSLSFVETLALGAFTSNKPPSELEENLALGAIGATVFVVLSLPITQLTVALVADASPTKSADRRTLRTVVGLRRDNLVASASLWGLKIDALRLERIVRHSLEQLADDAQDKPDGTVDQWHRALDGVLEQLASIHEARLINDDNGRRIAALQEEFTHGDSPARRKKRARRMRKLLVKLSQ